MKFKDYPEFCPDYTPQQMFTMGIFQDVGGYFRQIHSSITNKWYTKAYSEFKFFDKIPISKLVCKIDKNQNYYKTKCGSSLEAWEKAGWIHSPDVYGWVQWFCRFYSGRRSPDDERQIKRWIKFKKRFGNRKIKSNVIKQSLLHWAIDWEKTK